MNEALSRAIEELKAVEIAPGRYVYRDEASPHYYGQSTDDLVALGEALLAVGPDAYSFWCEDYAAVLMPDWWAPEHPFAWRPKDGGISRLPHADLDGWHESWYEDFERLTVDLTNGEEMPVPTSARENALAATKIERLSSIKTTNISMPEELWEEAKLLAVKRRISFAELVRQAVQHVINGDRIDEITMESDRLQRAKPPSKTVLKTRALGNTLQQVSRISGGAAVSVTVPVDSPDGFSPVAERCKECKVSWTVASLKDGVCPKCKAEEDFPW